MSNNMVKRKDYLNKLIKLKDKQLIKVITGVRRCGKSTLLKQFQEYLLENGVETNQIIDLNFERIENKSLLDYEQLYNHIILRVSKDKKTYVFLDEIQNVEKFQKTVDSLFINENIDLYITGSNAYMLSGELATLLSGRYIEIQMLPLSFAEFLQLSGEDKRDAFNRYFSQGGFPYLSFLEDEEIHLDYLASIYNTVLLKDIVARKKFQDASLLESITKFLLDNIGNIVSTKKIADTLTSYGRKTTPITAENYIKALQETFILYKADRYDIKGKQYLKSLEKYYIVDIGLRRLLLGNKFADIGHILENIVYLELIRKGYKVYIGKVGDLEINFVAEKNGDKAYYQISATVLDPTTYLREIRPLKSINDNYPKYLITMDEITNNHEGIQQIHIIDFLLDDY